MRWLRCPHVSIVSTSTMRLTYAPILFLQVQLFESLSMDGRRGCFADKQDFHMWTSPPALSLWNHSHLTTWVQAGLRDTCGLRRSSTNTGVRLHSAVMYYRVTLCWIFSCYPTLCCLWHITKIQEKRAQIAEYKNKTTRGGTGQSTELLQVAQ